MKRIVVFLVSIIQLCAVFGQAPSKAPDLKYRLHNITTEVRFINSNTVRVFKYTGDKAPEKNSLVVLKSAISPVKTVSGEKDNRLFVQSTRLRVELSKSDGTMRFFNGQHELLLSEAPSQQLFESASANEASKIGGVQQAFNLSDAEAIYGLGQHQTGKMNQRGQTILLRQRNMDIAIPFLQSTNGYGIYWDNASATIYKDSANKMSLSSEVGNAIDYYVIAGRNADQIIDGYRNLTGTVPMFPLWSFGYIQSRERYQSQEQVLDVVKKYRSLQVPLDAVVQDWQYWGGNDNWNSTAFENPKYPRPKAMIDSIHELHAKFLISVWPSFGGTSKIYQEMNQRKMLFDFTTYPESRTVKVYDAFNPAARKLYWTYMNKNLFEKGVDGWWLDATEPEQKGNGGYTGPDPYTTAVTRDTKTYLGPYNQFTNAFPFESVNGVYQHQRATTSDKRVFILTRSAFAGQQRDASMVWSGDITSSWQTLKRQIPAALNYSLSGLPYWNADIGGFFSGTNYPEGVKDLTYQELYIRWLQFAVFTGMMRSHGTNTPREIYQFGRPGDVAFDVIHKYIGWRYQLEPYLYSTSWDITSKNASLMRALVMDYPKDKNVYNLGDAYLFGKSILVAPITDSIFSKEDKKLNLTASVKQKIYLPKGNWYDYNTDKKLSGQQYIVQSYTLASMPVFVKAGAILPIAQVPQYSSIKNFKNLTIKIYPGKDGVFELYEDEGDNYNYEKGKYSLIKFEWIDRSKTLKIYKRQGGFATMEKNRTFNVKLAGSNKARFVQYNGDSLLVQFEGK